jgi:hypothetical protein
VQQASVLRRQALIAEAEQLAASEVLRVDAVKALQQRWQAEAQTMVLERRLEQKLWDAFRQPIDDAFQRKTAQREQASAAMNEHDRAVLQAAKSLEQANASADAAAIRLAMRQLEMAMRGEAPAVAAPTADAPVFEATAADAAEPGAPATDVVSAESTAAPSGNDAAVEVTAEPAPAVVPAVPVRAPKPVVAVRGDDRPGMKKAEPAPMGRGFKGRDGRDGRDSRDAPRGRPAEAGRGRDEGRGGGVAAAFPSRRHLRVEAGHRGHTR